MHEPTKPLLVRLPNWIGDVVMVLPALRLLETHGYALQLVGKGWASSLLSGEPWRVWTYPRAHRECVRLLRRLAAEARQQDANFDQRINALTFPNSFSSAWELRAAGLRAVGYRQDWRRLLLERSFALPAAVHQLMSYWGLAANFLQVNTTPPAQLDLHVAAAAQSRVATLLQTHGLQHGYIALCPFAHGMLRGQPKKWPYFSAFAARARQELGLPVVLCPGPNEANEARAHFAAATILNDIELADYAALLKAAALVVANDTGPGHIAAGVGARLLSVLGPTNPQRYGPWGASVTMLTDARGWPTLEQVMAAASKALEKR